MLKKIKHNHHHSNSVDEIMNHCEQYRSSLILYCRQYFEYDYETAEDCVQEAYLALLENLKKGIEINNYKSWLYSVTLNKKIMQLKTKSKETNINLKAVTRRKTQSIIDCHMISTMLIIW